MAGENINRRLNIYVNDEQVVNSMRGVGAAMSKVRNQIRNLDASAEDYDEQLQRLRRTYLELQRQHQSFRQQLAETPTLLGRIRTALGPVATGFLTAFSITAIVSKANQVISDGWRTVVDFNQKQADLAAIMGKSRSQVAGLTLDAMRYGATTSFTASQVSELQTELARLGKTEKEIKAMTKGVLDAAVALEADLGPAAELIGGQLNAFGEDASKSTEYADIMANSVNISATSFESLSTALPKVSKVADQEGVSFERLNAILGVLADENIAAETAGTGFRNILLESAKAGKTYEEMLQLVRNSSNQSKTAMELFGKENAVVAVTLANSTEKIERNTKALENSAGAAEELAKTKLDSLQGSTKLFSSAWEGFLLSIEKGDGVIAKAVKGMVDFGTSIISLLTPMNKLSDQLVKEQLELNILASKITSTNVSNDDRLKLLIQLNNQYPGLLENVDLETVSNEELNLVINKVNESYIKRIALQKMVEKAEKAQADQSGFQVQQTEKQLEIFSKLNRLKAESNLQVNIDFNNLTKSFQDVQAKMKERNLSSSLISDLQSDFELLTRINRGVNKTTDNFNILQQKVEETKKLLGIDTEAEIEEKATALPTKPAETKKPTGSDQLSEEEKKKRQKAIEDAKQYFEQLKAEKAKSDADLLAIQRANQDISLGLLQEGFDKERELINLEYNRKIQDVQLKIQEYQTEIDKLNQSLSDPKNSKADKEVIKQTLANKIAAQKEYNDQLVILEQTRDLKIGKLRQDYLKKEFENLEQAHARELEALQIRNNNELASIVSLEQAKEILKASLSEKELSQVRTLEQAKKLIKQKQLDEEYQMQEKHLVELAAYAQSIFAQEQLLGFDLISPEEREQIMKFLDEVALKLSNLGVKKAENNNEEGAEQTPNLSGIDILGFGADQWDAVFQNLDTMESKISAVSMVVGALGQAFSMFFSFFDAADQRSLNRFTRSQETKKKQLTDQLEKGYINQEIYNARMEKLEQEREKKQAELEYKRAVRERITSAFGIVANTGIAVAKSIAASPLTGGMPWAGIVAGIGALQLAGLLAQPLPPKSGYKMGGFTGFGSPDEEAGVVHKKEYVIPEKVLFSSDPAIPQIMSYLEAKRTGKGFKDGGFGDERTPLVLPAPDPGGTLLGNATDATLHRLASILEKLEEKEWMAYLVNDFPTAKKIREKIRELENLENQAKK
ncbi:MAG: phage tail tape measure protein [Flavobacteriales bacterium]|nr:phage tail tape measure protein [Flavobacteriales bacterium]